jgi:hypothetical protein
MLRNAFAFGNPSLRFIGRLYLIAGACRQ